MRFLLRNLLPRPLPALAAVVSIALLLSPALRLPAEPGPASPAQRVPVLVELFTSEGCSDCPPADALLAKLDSQQFVAGAQAIVLSEHVTYWNHLGWRDPFSFDAIDERQQKYAQQFALGSEYTPQIVVDGAAQLVGSDVSALTRTVARAAQAPKLAITISGARRAADGSVAFSIRAANPHDVIVMAALAENATQSEVSRGENAGRVLHHVAVVRVLKDFSSNATDGRVLQLPAPGRVNTAKDDGPLRLVVFLLNRMNGHAVAVAEQTLTQ